MPKRSRELVMQEFDVWADRYVEYDDLHATTRKTHTIKVVWWVIGIILVMVDGPSLMNLSRNLWAVLLVSITLSTTTTTMDADDDEYQVPSQVKLPQ